MTTIENALHKYLRNPRVMSGFEKIDDLTSGWERGTLIMIAAPKRMGKTPFAISMMLNGLTRFNYGYLWYSTNLSVSQLMRMVVSNHTGMSIDMNILQPVEVAALNDLFRQYRMMNMHFEDEPGLSCKRIDKQLESLKSQQLPDCIVVDNLNSLNFRGFMSETDEIRNTNANLVELKSIARKYDIPVVVLYECEFPENMGADFSKEEVNLNFKHTLVDTLCFIYRPEYYKVVENANGESTLGTAVFSISGNNAFTDDLALLYDFNHYRFHSVPE